MVLIMKNEDSVYILLVEDDCISQKLIKHILINKGYNVDIACNGNEALLFLESKSYDIILTDINMPEMDGFQLVQMIKSKNINTPIIALTAASMKEDKEKCLKLGMDDYISKPIGANILYEKIKKLLK